jgi:hypothetical protein
MKNKSYFVKNLETQVDKKMVGSKQANASNNA